MKPQPRLGTGNAAMEQLGFKTLRGGPVKEAAAMAEIYKEAYRARQRLGPPVFMPPSGDGSPKATGLARRTAGCYAGTSRWPNSRPC